MEEGSFRCDANISIRPEGSSETLAKIEVQHMNSFKAVYHALGYEAERQRKVVGEGGELFQETRGWLDDKGITQSQRSKEYAHDYRYFPEPDLPPLTMSPALVKEIESCLPELPEPKRDRFMSQYSLALSDANLLTSSKSLADYFEVCVNLSQIMPLEKRAKNLANWLLGDFAHMLNTAGIEVDQSKVSPDNLVELLDLIDKGTLGGPAAKTVLEEMFYTGKPAREIVAEKGLTQISDTSAVEDIVRQVIDSNPQAVADFRAGKEQAVKFLIGQAMRATKGRANPKMVNDILKQKLE